MNDIILSEIGLTDSEIKVYKALLELGDSTRGDIVNKAQIAGSKIYEILERLQEKGLVSVYSQNKVKHFKPVNPKQLIIYLEQKQRSLKELSHQTQELLPQLMSTYMSSKEEQELELYTGLKGLEIIFREQVDLLKPGETCYVIGGTRGSDEGDVQAFFERIHVMRQEKGIKTRMLFNKIQKSATEKRYSSRRYPLTQSRYIDHSSPVAINIYADRTVIIIFSKKISAIHIKSTEVSKSFLEYFNILWKQADK
jgi:HTH-type transcriptional regulator, sugar sensing transcriptional regulator